MTKSHEDDPGQVHLDTETVRKHAEGEHGRVYKEGDRVWYTPKKGIKFPGVVVADTRIFSVQVLLSASYSVWGGGKGYAATKSVSPLDLDDRFGDDVTDADEAYATTDFEVKC